jgi:ubiquitin-protein ligase
MNPSNTLHRRVFTDFMQLCEEAEKDTSIKLFYDDSNIDQFDVGISGLEGTPYIGGLYVFRFNMNHDYPFNPPSVEFISRSKRMRIHPNFYDNNGKVCLSILGTWPGPSWTSGMTLHTIVITIQSLFSKDSITNEPGFETSSQSLINKYNNAIIVMKHNYMFKCITKKGDKEEWEEEASNVFKAELSSIIHEFLLFQLHNQDIDNLRIGIYGICINIKRNNIYKNIKSICNSLGMNKIDVLFLFIVIWFKINPINETIINSDNSLETPRYNRDLSLVSSINNKNNIPDFIMLDILKLFQKKCNSDNAKLIALLNSFINDKDLSVDPKKYLDFYKNENISNFETLKEKLIEICSSS